MKKLCMYALAPAIALALSATAPATAQEAAVVDNGPPNGPPNGEGRRHLPALRAGQPFGRANGDEIQVAIRDTGKFMDPRTRKDWWHGR